jgi:hypothetical protein
MAEGLQTPDGKKLELEAAEQTFAAAMAAPETDVPAPRKMTAEQKQAIKDEPKRTRARTAKTEKPRTTAKASEKVDKDFTEDIAGITTGVWLTAASVPYTQAYAALIKVNQPALVASLNQGAQNNSQIRGYVEKLSTGGGGVWMLSLGVTSANMAMQALQIARDPKLRSQLAEQTKADLNAYLAENGLVQKIEAETDAGTDAS